jgi:hypothetical protein
MVVIRGGKLANYSRNIQFPSSTGDCLLQCAFHFEFGLWTVRECYNSFLVSTL